MRAGLAVGVGAGCLGLGVVFVVARAAQAKREELPSDPKSASGPAGPLAVNPALPPELASGLEQWVSTLAAKPVPDADAVMAAALFANRLAQAGFAGAATTLRNTIDQATAAGRPSPEESPPSMSDESEPERTELWVDHYLGGWQTTPDFVQALVRDALDHLSSESDGYVRQKPSEWDALQAGETAGELDRLGYPTLGAGVRDLVADAQQLPERAP